jgi:N-methylhydantoinase A
LGRQCYINAEQFGLTSAMSDQTRNSAYRIGIDVGGTFTKAALLDNRTHAVLARSSVHTTHHHERGVAAGVVEVFRQVLKEARVAPESVVFLAHSTTQATNALLEGDVAHVGVVGMAPAKAAKLASQQARIDPIELAAGKVLKTSNRFLISGTLTEHEAEQAVRAMVQEGAAVIVASAAFGVDDTSSEEMVRDVAQRSGLVTTCGHEITKLYGLSTRTKTAVINASILPKMIATANMTEASVRESGITAPLMIMRGDGGVMDIHEMLRRPALTMLSGPAASVAGALMHTRMSDGIYFEVGGTSTNVGVVKDGRPSVAYARVGGHETFVNSLDIRVIGVAGGSLVRAHPDAGIVDVGPRSAHIAGLPYAAFASPADFDGARVIQFEPSGGEGVEYVAIEACSGQRYAVTSTCAANALGLVDSAMHAYADPAAACHAFDLLARYLHSDVEAVATAVLDRAVSKLVPVLESLSAEYRLDPDQQTLIGVGGGVGALIRHLANRTGHKYAVPKDAEIISSIGAALAMVREVVERIIPNPTPDDLLAIRKEALDAAARLGANSTGIDVSVEVDKATGRVRAVAVGSAEMQSKRAEDCIDEHEARRIAAQSLALAPDSIVLRAEIPTMRVYATAADGFAPVRVIDHQGRIRIQRSAAMAEATSGRNCIRSLTELRRQQLANPSQSPDFGGAFVLYDRHVVDLCSIPDFEQAAALARDELLRVAADTPTLIIWLPERAEAVRVEHADP